MFDEVINLYTPRVIICGDMKKFLDLNVEVVGLIKFRGAAERGENFLFTTLKDLDDLPFDETKFQIFLDDEEISCNALKKIMDGTADYIVFEDSGELISRFNELYRLGLQDRFITLETLMKYATKNFYSIKNAEALPKLLREQKISRLLDVDNFLAANDLFFVKDFPDVEVETVDDSFAKKFPVVENLCKKIYPSLDACRLKTYDAVLITAERSPTEFIDALIETDSLAENIFVLVRKNSALEKFLTTNENAFEKISRYPAINGNWILLKKFARDDFKIYVVTHKDAKLSTLPDGYEIIHAGHAIAKNDFGYLGDDTGDNISRLNRYLNEITAIYWMWKNTSHAIIGLCHYRRFFTADGKNFLTEAQARKILRGCDVVVVKENFFALTQHELKTLICGDDLNAFVEEIFRKHIARRQPDYLDAFDYVSGSFAEFMYEMFITRRKIFDAYCEWLFSFVIDVTEEVLAKTNLADIDNPRKYRAIGLISERLMTAWLMKNSLRLKALPVIFRADV